MATPGELLHMMESLERENAKRQAQVAVMADCLKWLDDHHAAGHGAWNDDAEEYDERRNNQVLDTIQQVLQSAPKVLYRKTMDRWGAFYSLGCFTFQEAQDGGKVDVIVLECSVNDASEPKSEQEE